MSLIYRPVKYIMKSFRNKIVAFLQIWTYILPILHFHSPWYNHATYVISEDITMLHLEDIGYKQTMSKNWLKCPVKTQKLHPFTLTRLYIYTIQYKVVQL